MSVWSSQVQESPVLRKTVQMCEYTVLNCQQLYYEEQQNKVSNECLRLS